jgi:hypothetical protein
MKTNRKAIVLSVLLGICLIIRLYSLGENRAEMGYSREFFPILAVFLRYTFGFLPLSVGDIFYGLLVGWVIVKLNSYFFYIFQNKSKPHPLKVIRKYSYKILVVACSIYIIFNIAWGINYNRRGIAWQLGLPVTEYSPEQLKEMNCLLIDRINASKQALVDQRFTYPSNAGLFRMLSASYKKLAETYPYLKYKQPSIKKSMWGKLGNYAGFTGYYNPFTGEAQLNTTIPKFLQPYTACHEVAHQLGYAKENEANFVGFLAAVASHDTLFHYSVYLDMFMYANRNLYETDSLSAKLYRKELIPPVQVDIREWMAFNKKHRSLLEPAYRWMYGKFLQSNEQPGGIRSYSEVTSFLIAYYKKFGHI